MKGENRPWVREKGEIGHGWKGNKGNVYADRLSPDSKQSVNHEFNWKHFQKSFDLLDSSNLRSGEFGS